MKDDFIVSDDFQGVKCQGRGGESGATAPGFHLDGSPEPWGGVGFYTGIYPTVTPPFQTHVFSCRCQSVWCPSCSKKKTKGMTDRVKTFNWKTTRHISFTIDRKKFPEGPRDCYEVVKKSECFNRLIRNLERVHGLTVFDWMWSLEWHKDGFPHWHLLVDKEGIGMIGGDLLRSYWEHGAVYEEYFESETHWISITGYFGKGGYFGSSKDFQGRLPDWALDSDHKIRRWGAKQNKDYEPKEKVPVRKTKGGGARRTYRAILQGCGEKSRIKIKTPEREIFSTVYEKVSVLKVGFIYVPGEGYVREFDSFGLETWLKSHIALAGLLHALVPDILIQGQRGVLGES